MRARALLVALALGCSGGGSELDLAERASAAFSDCDPVSIQRLAERQSLQLALKPCGANQGVAGQWSDDGRELAFWLPGGATVLDGVAKTLQPIPGEAPLIAPAWLEPGVVALALEPAPGGSGCRLARLDLRQSTMEVVAVPETAPRDLAALAGGALLLTAVGADGARRPAALTWGSAALAPALPWLTAPVEQLSLAGDLVGWADASGAHVARASTGEVLEDLPGFTAALPHRDGRYVALSGPGAPISTFDQRPWGDTTPTERARQAERTQAWLERLPPDVPTTVRPPEIQILDLETGARWRFLAYYGDHLQWYPGRSGWLSLSLWGIEGKQVNANVALADVLTRVRLAEAGAADAGVQRVSP